MTHLFGLPVRLLRPGDVPSGAAGPLAIAVALPADLTLGARLLLLRPTYAEGYSRHVCVLGTPELLIARLSWPPLDMRPRRSRDLYGLCTLRCPAKAAPAYNSSNNDCHSAIKAAQLNALADPARTQSILGHGQMQSAPLVWFTAPCCQPEGYPYPGLCLMAPVPDSAREQPACGTFIINHQIKADSTLWVQKGSGLTDCVMNMVRLRQPLCCR